MGDLRALHRAKHGAFPASAPPGPFQAAHNRYPRPRALPDSGLRRPPRGSGGCGRRAHKGGAARVPSSAAA